MLARSGRSLSAVSARAEEWFPDFGGSVGDTVRHVGLGVTEPDYYRVDPRGELFSEGVVLPGDLSFSEWFDGLVMAASAHVDVAFGELQS
jgi:hypothetical protein